MIDNSTDCLLVIDVQNDFCAGGALAVENALKVAFDWKRQKNRAAGIDRGGDKILHFREAFHGRSGYTARNFIQSSKPTERS